ncbi:MAG TPA: DnaJ domain-containing protein [Blastocatellia bacterium]|nr:DnaJ domain-containing protein [Blastocatellia bacterium]
MQGQLGAKLVTDLIREIAQKQRNGLLRLTRGKTIKAIFFESGEPKFAISNLTGEQLDNLLTKKSLVNTAQLEEAKARAGKVPRLARELVDMGLISPEAMRKAVREQVMEIILSLFEWTQGDYQLDERIRAAHDYTLDMSAADVILEGARRMAKNEQLAAAIAPSDAVLIRGRANGIDSGVLLPVESYILSRIEAPTAVSDVGMLSGLADADAHRAVVSLVAAGFLKLVGDDRDVTEEAEAESDENADWLRQEVSRKLHFFSQADFYEILSVTRNASTAEIKAAYYQLAKKFHPDRHRQPGFTELKPQLDALFSLITQAYQTLAEASQRAVYDARLKKPAAAFQTTPLKPPPAFAAEPIEPRAEPKAQPKSAPRPAPTPAPISMPTEPPRPRADASPSSGELHRPPVKEATSGPLSQNTRPPATPGEASANDAAKPAGAGQSGGNSAQLAEHYFNQGRARYERKEYHAAVHLLREAVKLDGSKSNFHFHLGIALLRNPRTRREADEHLQRAAELEPYNSQLRIKLGNIYKEVGLPKKAEAFFRAALQLDPDNRTARKEIASHAPSKKVPEGPIWKQDIGTIAKRIFKK